jgi:nitroreductase
MELFDAIYGRRSIRRYTDQPVRREEILEILKAGSWAPSGLNNQPWRFLVVGRSDPRQAGLAELTKYGPIVRSAGALIVVLLSREEMYHPMKDYQGAGACIQNMLLAIHGQGLGGVWLGEIVNRSEEVLRVLGLDPAMHALMAVIAVGRPDQRGSSSRKPLSELLLEELPEERL